MVKLELSAESWGNGKARSLRPKRASSSWSLVFFETNSPRSELTDSVSNSSSSRQDPITVMCCIKPFCADCMYDGGPSYIRL